MIKININEYFEGYLSYKRAAAALGKSIEGLKLEMGANLVCSYSEKVKSSHQDDKMYNDYISLEDLKKNYEKKRRILERANSRINEALKTTHDEFYRNFIICKYIYGMKYADIAENLNYCERHIYRLASAAKFEFSKQLKLQMPKPVHGMINKKYYCKNRKKGIRRYIKSGYVCSKSPASASRVTCAPSGSVILGVV